MTQIFPITSKLEQHRDKFPGLANKTYFNFGGQGTMPRQAIEAIVNAYEYIQNKGPFTLEINDWIEKRVPLIRSAIASELGTAAETITLTENVTTGCNIALWGIDWQPGDGILMTDCEHPGIIATVKEISRRFGVEVSICPIMATLNDGDPVAVIRSHLKQNTRLVVLSHLLWNTGQVLPVAEIVRVCHNYDRSNKPVQVLVDAAQSVGSLPLNLSELEADFYAFTGHKWLCGPAGVGGLYVRPEALETIHPTFIGLRGIYKDEKGQPLGWKEDGRRFEVSTSAHPLYEGLQESLATHQQWGNSQQRYQQICQLSEYLWQGLSRIERINCLKNSPPEAGLVCFQVTGNISHKKLVKNLEKQGFMLRTLADPDCVRACVHYFTLPTEIDKLIAAIADLL
ncbi:MAG: aminotransferase class V-fold PLP-dependent enzyme [Prochloraceae cyanobacterium]|nr:aminotransferase class V-fold PLP-dependent enzyme [Prochloraceae cyanobacterium]